MSLAKDEIFRQMEEEVKCVNCRYWSAENPGLYETGECSQCGEFTMGSSNCSATKMSSDEFEPPEDD